MTASAAVTHRILALFQPGTDYSMGDVRALARGHGVSDVQLRNALCGLSKSRRLLKSGGHTHGRYRLNLHPPRVHADAARHAFAANDGAPPEPAAAAPAIAPVWPAAPLPPRFDRTPIWRIA
jgi:hypothetical protein